MVEPAGAPLVVVYVLVVVVDVLVLELVVVLTCDVCCDPGGGFGCSSPALFVCVTGPSVFVPCSDGFQQIMRPEDAV